VIPRRPPGTSELSEEELAALVTRDSMIGVAQPAAPAAAAA
jgi:nitrile hydratase